MLAAPGVACVLGHEQTDWSGSLHSHEAAQFGVDLRPAWNVTVAGSTSAASMSVTSSGIGMTRPR